MQGLSRHGSHPGGGPTGPKGQGVIAAYSAAVGGAAGAGAGLNEKYTLNDRGQIFYTLVKCAGTGASMTMEERCLNHVINLRPLCGACNTSNRNRPHSF
ncbi:MAG: hypothetical protein JSR71_00765 [Proteobacteria bacterium]|nr:hypothetical protein [Pseudomonadota bacterium]